jgi:hypothetical protein
MDGVRREYEIAFGRYGRDKAAVGFAVARADAPGGGEADAERFSALMEALTGKRPQKQQHHRDRMRQKAPRRLRQLRRTRRRRREVARGDEPMNPAHRPGLKGNISSI